MQSLSVPAARNPNGHSPAEILAALQGIGGGRSLDFRYELYDVAGNYVRDLDNVKSCSIEQNWLADIKRTARFTIRDTGVINLLTDRIKPYVRINLPPYGPDDWAEWPQGLFALQSPRRNANESGVVTREIVAYDLLQSVADMTVTDRYVVAAGSNYLTTIRTLLLAVPQPIAPRVPTSAAALPSDREWPPGTPYLRIVNDLLAAINYESLSYDEDGAAVVRPYQSPAARAEEYAHASDSTSLIVPDVQQELDLWAVPNQWLLIVSDPDRPMLRSVYTNNDPASLTSTVRRGRVIAAEPQYVDAADQSTLDAMAARAAFEASQIYEAVEFSTALFPIHSGNDVYRLRYGPLAINAKYIEHSWSMDLEAGARMRHRARRVVTV